MSYNFTDEDKAATGDFQDRIDFGVHEVKIVGATAGQTDSGKDWLEITVADSNGVEDAGRFWFTGGASPYSFQGIRQIIVHTAAEADKEKARMAVENTKNTDDLADLINSKCIGKQIWFSKFYRADGSTYTTDNGTFRQTDRKVYGYRPKDQPDLMPSKSQPAAADPLAGATPATGDAAANIPSDWK